MAKEYVYIVTHPNVTDWVKVGMCTTAPEKRLSGYQTGCPFRAYEMVFHQEISNSRALEKEVFLNLDDMGIERRNEWWRTHVDLARSIIETSVNDLE
jgi:hypothetical protein